MTQAPSPREPIVEDDRKPTWAFGAFLRVVTKDSETLEALIAHLIAEGVIAADWRT